MQFVITPAAASPSLLSKLDLGTHWVQHFSRSAPTASDPAGPGGIIPLVLNYRGEIQHKNFRWDDRARDQYHRPGFIYGFNLNFGSRCLVPALSVKYPDDAAVGGVSSIEGDGRTPIWIAATIHEKGGVETFSILTAPRHEQSAATSAHEPVFIAPANAVQWFDTSIHPSQLLRATAGLGNANPLVWKVT